METFFICLAFVVFFSVICFLAGKELGKLEGLKKAKEIDTLAKTK
jgi:hypothetical protein